MKKNILLITVDALRSDCISFYNNNKWGVKTDFIDSLCSKSAVFTNAYTSFSGTPSAVASILYGLTPMHHGCFFICADYITPIRCNNPSLQKILKNAGYKTGAITSMSFLDKHLGFNNDFDLFKCLGSKIPANRLNEEAFDFLNNTPEPFFLWMHYSETHSPYGKQKEFSGRTQKLYFQNLLYFEKNFQELLQKIDLEKTIIILTADHGELFGEHNLFLHANFYEQSIKIPLIIYGLSDPAIIKKRVRNFDICPTLLEEILHYKGNFDGINLFSNENTNLPVYCGLKNEDNIIYACLIENNYKYILDNFNIIKFYEFHLSNILKKILKEKHKNKILKIFKNSKLRKFIINKTKPLEFLFDLEIDPMENLNLLSKKVNVFSNTYAKYLKVEEIWPDLDLKKYFNIRKQMNLKLTEYINNKNFNSTIQFEMDEDSELRKNLSELGYL